MAPTATTNSADGAYWSTYYNSAANVKVDDNTTVYKAAISNNSVVLTEISDKVINAGQAVVLKKSVAGAVALTPQAAASTDDYTDNELLGTDAPIAQEAGCNYYVLSKKSDVFGFYKLADSKKLGAGKAYLKVPTTTTAREFLGIDAEETTAIRTTNYTNYTNYTNSDSIYDLQGRKVSNPTKGLYIVNGKKVLLP